MNFEEAKFKAIKYIGISKKTEYEVVIKLKKLNIDKEIIDKVVKYLLKYDYINDLEYVNSYIRQNVRMNKYSIYEISEKLKLKGINSDIIDIKLNSLEETDYENDTFLKIFNTKSKTMDKIKIKQYLYRRGFKFKGV